jgi:hypothetical protein
MAASSGGGLDVLRAVQTYVNKVVTATSGIKVLLLDADTVSASCSRKRLYGAHWTPRPDGYTLAGYHAVCAALARSLPHRQDRQPFAFSAFVVIVSARERWSREAAASQVCMPLTADRGEHRSLRKGDSRSSLRQLLALFVLPPVW